MARLPSRYDLSAPASLNSGRMISSADMTPIGRGQQAFGRAVQQTGADVHAAMEKQRQREMTVDLARANAFQDQQNIALANEFDKDPDYATFGVRAPKKAKEIAATAAQFIRDPEARDLWRLQGDTTAARAADAVADKGTLLQRQADVVNFDEALEVQRRIYIDPNSPEDAKEKARAAIEGAISVGLGSGLLTPESAEQRTDTYLRRADFERAKLDTTVSDPREAYFAAIRSAESGGNDNAANPKSSARGRYQFIESTWNRLVEKYPGAGLTKGGRFDPQQQERAIRLFTAENEASLRSAGVPVTNGSLYAAHFLGADGASDVLRAADGAALEGVLPSEVIKANPFLKGMTVGRFKAWADEKGGGAGKLPAYIERLPADQRQVVYDMRAAEQAKLATAEAAQAKVDYEEHRSATELGILTGSVVSEQQVLSDPLLLDDDKAELVRSLRSEQNATADARALLAGIGDGTAPDLNPYDSDDRARAEKAYDLLTKSVAPEQQQAATVSFIESTGIVPKPVVADVRRNLGSTNPTEVAAGLQQSAALFDVAPQALDAMENGKEIRDAAATYRELVEGRGLTVEQAAAEVVAMNDPANKRRTDDLKEGWTQAVKDKAFQLSDVTSAFDGGLFGGGQPVAGVTPAQVAALNTDYLSAAERAFKGKANGDAGIARRMAVEEMKRLYGVSETSGQRALMKYPPELYYPPIGDDQGYIRDFVMKDARSIAPDAVNAMLVPTGETVQDVRGGRMPRYDLMYQRADGVWDIAPDLFTIGPDEIKAMTALASEERALRFQLERAKAEQEATTTPVDIGLGIQIPRPNAGWNAQPLTDDDKAQLDDIAKRRRELLGIPEKPVTDDQEAERKWLELQSETFGMMGGAAK